MHDQDEFEEEYDGYAIRPNKTQLKREADALVELGKKLAELDNASLTALELPGDLLNAVEEVKAIRSNSARKRQFKLIGKILRGMETDELERLFDNREQSHRGEVNAFHEVERWRDRLIADGISGGSDAMSEFLSKYPGVDRQRLNQLVRSAVKEASMEKPPKSARQLFKYLKELLKQSF